MHRYLRDKIYATPFGDLVPLIVANALETNIIIIEDKLTRKVIREVKPFDVGNASHLMILYKKGDHYDACFPINDRANVNDLITTRPLGKDRRRKCVQDKVPKRSDICSSGQSKDKRAGKWSESHRRLENIKFGHINSRSLYPKKRRNWIYHYQKWLWCILYIGNMAIWACQGQWYKYTWIKHI